jgi:hypothetical protein
MKSSQRSGLLRAPQLLPAVRERAEVLTNAEAFLADGRRMLGDISASVNKKLGGPRR